MYLKKQILSAALIFSAIFFFCQAGPVAAMEDSAPITAGANTATTLDKGDPVNMATAEYHFDMELFNLGGPFSPGFSIYYGSQAGKRITKDGLPKNFMGSNTATISNLSSMDRFDLEIARGKRIGFTPWGADSSEAIPWQLVETSDYYYIMNPVTGIIRTLARHDTQSGYKTYNRVNISDSGTQADDYSMSPDISRDGRFVAFRSTADNLVEGDTNNHSDIFVHDRLEGTTTRVSVASDGTEADNDSSDPSISADGRYVAFQSFATNLDDNANKYGVFIHDTATDMTTWIAYGSDPSISADGRYVILESSDGNIFVYDTESKVFTRISDASDGTPADSYSRVGSITSNGVAVFYSKATNLVEDDNNSRLDIFVHDLNTGVTTRVSIASNGVEGDENSFNPSISENGNLIAFYSDATNLVTGDTNTGKDVFVHNMQTGETSRVSVASDGSQGNNSSSYCDISPDGRFVVFLSSASNFLPYNLDRNNVSDIFIHDLQTGETIRASNTYDHGLPSNGTSYTESISISEYGRYVAFSSDADNLVSGDTNNEPDIFVAGRFSNSLSATAFLVRREDRNGNGINYEYPADPSSRGPDRMSDGLGRELKFTYDENQYLTKVEDQQGRSWQFTYEGSPADNPGGGWTLRSMTDPMGGATSFTYDGTDQHIIGAMQMPKGNTPYTQAYDHSGYEYGLVASQTDAYGNVTSIIMAQYDWIDPVSRFTVNTPDGSSEVYEHDHYYTVAKSRKDASGKSIQFQSDPDKRMLTGITDRMGDTTSATYHPESGQVASITDALGQLTSFIRTPQKQTITNPVNGEQVTFTFYNLTRIEYPDGTNEKFTYDAKGNMLSRTDQAGKTWSFSYNTRGQVLSVKKPTAGTITYTYNADGTLASVNDPDTGTTNYDYDLCKRMNLVTFTDGKTIQTTYDLNDRITSTTDERSKTWTYSYDANGNLLNISDPSGSSIVYAYDLMDRLVSVTDQAGKITATTYDNMGRIASVTDPDNIQTAIAYDPRGWMNAITRGGKTWRTGYDDEGVASSFITPTGGQTTGFQTNKLGLTTGLTDPLNHQTTFSRDAMQRITRITDAIGRTTDFTYDGAGRITGVTIPSAESASYQYNSLGRLTGLTDVNGENWFFTYSAMGRTTGFTDPLGHAWAYQYDNRGRLGSITMPDGTSATRQYDGAGDLLQLSYGGELTLNYTYDDLGRILTANGIGFTYSLRGEITSTDNHGTAFDAAYADSGRLETVSYADDAFSVTYSYNSTSGLLTGVTDSLTNTSINFTYNDDNMLTGISRPNGIDTAFTFDNAARITRIQHGTLADMNFTLDAAGQITKADMDLPLDPGALLANNVEIISHDDASQVNSTGYTYDNLGRRIHDPSGAYTWDNGGRLTGVGGATLAYNGSGDLSGRTKGGNTVNYYYNYAIELHPVVAERDGAGAWLRYYVYTPAGRLLYMIDAENNNAVSFYHFDRVGSTLFLTDTAGAITDSYAYTPYGRLLQHNGNNPQPFTFAGEFGVRQEGTSGMLYHMRARYYAAVTGSFLSREPLWPQPREPRKLNPYQYAMGKPMQNIDATGLDTGQGSVLPGRARESARKLNARISAGDPAALRYEENNINARISAGDESALNDAMKFQMLSNALNDRAGGSDETIGNSGPFVKSVAKFMKDKENNINVRLRAGDESALRDAVRHKIASDALFNGSPDSGKTIGNSGPFVKGVEVFNQIKAFEHAGGGIAGSVSGSGL